MRSWQPGDRALCITPGSRIHGIQVTITSELMLLILTSVNEVRSAYRVDPGFECPNATSWGAEPQNLVPIPDEDDKFERFHADLVPCDADYEWNPEVVTL